MADSHPIRFNRALLALDGLSVGDAFGQKFFSFGKDEEVLARIKARQLPESPWRITDDSIMALAIVRGLRHRQRIEQDELAEMFARDFMQDRNRGYGGTAVSILTRIAAGEPWRVVAKSAFGGEGSCGNGGGMRSAPLGAYFSDDLDLLVEQARLSSEVTHAHLDGQTGAIAVALAAAWMVKHCPKMPDLAMIRFVLERLPRTETYDGLVKALEIPLTRPVQEAADVLGNGSLVTSANTVPFCLWCACRFPDNYVEAMWGTVSALGDRDTTCAIVGGLVGLSTGLNGIPEEWLDARETLVI